MDWRRFVVFNALGGATWVTVMAGAGYLFGAQAERVLGSLHMLGAVALVVAAVALLLARRYLGKKLKR